jgi:hypothetical protein
MISGGLFISIGDVVFILNKTGINKTDNNKTAELTVLN